MRPAKRRSLAQAVWRTGRAVIGPATLAAIGIWLAVSLAASPFLHVSRLVVRGNVRLSAHEVEALAAGMRGESILRVDFGEYTRRVRESPWVASVVLSRVLPSTVEIRITERLPMAIARHAQQLYLVDGTGVIIDAYGPQHRDVDLPIVDGLIDAGATGGGAVPGDRLQATARLLAALAAEPSLGDRVSQVDVSNPRDVVVLLDDDQARLHLGEGEFAARLSRYLELAPSLRERMADIDYVDLRFGDRVFLRSGAATASVHRTGLRPQ